jgi:predicted GNAT family acetyltransferase
LAEATAAAYADLAANLRPGLEARLFRPAEEPVPTGWETLSANPIQQMIVMNISQLSNHPLVETAEILSLRSADAADMLTPAQISKPGPFGPRTGELGHYIGVRDPDGRLVAMAGERFRLPDYVELSAICVHSDARGKGLGAALALHLARAVFARGEVPFLHVYANNPATGLYTRLGFEVRATLWVSWRRPLAVGART